MPARYSKTFCSGTPGYPTPRLLVERMVGELVINAAYGFSEDYQALFARQQVTIPDGWRVTKFKTKGWLGTGTMLLTTGIRDVDRIAPFVDRLFAALYGEQAGYKLSGIFQSSP